MNKINIKEINEIDRNTWHKLKAELLEIQQEFEERNGMPYCKNCNMDYHQLIKGIETIFKPR